MHAASRGHAEVVRRLLAAGAEVDAPFPAPQVEEDHDDDFDEEDFEEEDEEIEDQDDDDIEDEEEEEEEEYDEYGRCRTPLTMACHSDVAGPAMLQIVDLLLSAGADPNFADEVGQSLLMTAAVREQVEVVRRLLAVGADVDASARDGRTALHYALADDDNREAVAAIARELVAAGADINRRDRRGRTPLMLAAGLGFVELVQDWLTRGSDPHQTDKKGRNALAYAARTLANITRDTDPKYDAEEVREGLAQLRIDPDSKLGQQAMAYAEPRTEPTPFELLQSGAESAGEFETTRIKGLQWLNETIDLLVARECSPDSSARYLAKAGRLDLLKLVSREALNAIDEETGQTALTQAVEDSQVARVRLLLEAGADPNARNYYGNLPLMCAEPTRRGFECARLLIERGADPSAENENGLTVIDEALIMMQASKIPFLLEAGADPRKGKPLLWALTREMLEEFELLLAHGADPNAELGVDNAHHFPEYLRGTTAFMRAAADQPIDVLQRMLEAGANIDAADRAGQTAVGIAIRFGRQDVADWLRQQGARDPSVAGYSAALLQAAEQGDAERVAECLSHGADPDFRDDHGWLPLMRASRKGHASIVQQLLKAGADVNLSREGGYGPLHCAVECGSCEIVELLIQAGADVNKTHRFGSPALHQAVFWDSADMVEVLLAAGADPNGVDENDRTPLVAAVRNHCWELAERLIAAGTKPRPQDTVYLAQLKFSKTAARPAFAASLAQVERLCGIAGQQQKPGLVSWTIAPDSAPPPIDPHEKYVAWWQQHQDKIWRLLDTGYEDCLARGHLLLHTGNVSLLPTDDKFAALTFFNIAGNEEPMDTPKIVAGLKRLDQEQPFRLRGCRTKWLSIEFTTPTADPEALARRLTEIHHGFGGNFPSMAAMVRRLASQSRIDLSWE
jgi:ankyrin repeat protein